MTSSPCLMTALCTTDRMTALRPRTWYADQDGPGHEGTEDGVVVRALRAVARAVALAQAHVRERARGGAEVGDALVVLEARELRQTEARVDVGQHVADAALALAAGGDH